MNPLNSQVIKGYQLGELIGEGGFGAVYRAYQPIIEREVAIKVILPEHANQPDFIRRFELEAQLIARLEHPYIVPLYDYWREAGHAYLVMRLLQSNLRAALSAGPWTVKATQRLLDQVAAALTVAHRNGILHRDIKPDNILLDKDKNAYLADFGIAISIDQTVSTADDISGIGSLFYTTPEQIKGEPLTARADLYSLGIVLFELLTGEKPFPLSLTLSELLDKQLYAPLPPLSSIRSDLPPALDTVIQQATSKSPLDRYPDALSLAASFRYALRGSKSAIRIPANIAGGVPGTTAGSHDAQSVSIEPAPQNPYKGLRAFVEADAADFFGRQTLIQHLLQRLAESNVNAPFLAVIGPSGSGKSSVIHAGLLSALRWGALPGSDRWFVADIVPGAQPFDNLEAALLSVATDPPVGLHDQLRQDEAGLTRVIRTVLAADPESTLLLVIDQFEEVFTLVDNEAERVQFLNSLRLAVRDLGGRFRLIIALRADFVDRPLQYAGFGELIRQRNEFVLPLLPEELEQAIVRPAQRVGVSIEPDLLPVIINDVGEQPGTLPLLQYALTKLFDHPQGDVLTLDAYRASGGVLGALARHAEDLYTGLDTAQQAATRQLFLRLVTPGDGIEDTRRRVGRAELASLSKEDKSLERVIDVFGEHRLLTFDHDRATRRPTVEVAHEALIRTWGRLRDWLMDSREDLRSQRRLMAAAMEWINAGRETSFLADGARLEQFESWAHETTLELNQEELEYLQASIAEKQLRDARDFARKERETRTAQLVTNFQRATIALGIVGALAVVAIIALGVQTGNATRAVGLANQQVATSRYSIGLVGQTLTPIPVTLTAAAQQVADGQKTVEQLSLAADADKLLLSSDGNVETASLLSIRALQMAYLAEADTALRQAVERNYTQQIFSGHTDAVYGVAFAPDGKTVVTGSVDNTARLWDVRTGKTLQIFRGHTDSVSAVAFSPDSKYVLTGSKDQTARMWDVQTGRTVRLFKTRITAMYHPGHVGAINSVAFSPDGKYVVTGSRDKSAKIWDVQTGYSVQYFKHVDGVFSVAYSPDGKFVLTGSRGKNAFLWNVQTGRTERIFTGHTGAIWAVAISGDGKYMLTGSGDTTAKLWDLQTGDIIHVFKGHLSDVTGVAFSPDGKYALTVSADNTARLWDVQSGQTVRIFTGHTGSIWSAAFSPDGTSILTGSDDQTARLWDARADQSPYIFASHPAAVWAADFSPDGKYILTGSDDDTAQLWDRQTKQHLLTFAGPKTPVYAVAFSGDGNFVLTGTSDNTADLWDIHSGKMIHEFQSLTKDAIYTVAFSPDGKSILTGGVDNTARIWDIQTGAVVRTLTGHTNAVASAVFSPDGKYVLTGSYDHTARIWNTETGQTVQTLVGHTGTVSSAVFSPDGNFILTGSADNTAQLWDAHTGKNLNTFIGHTNAVASVAFSPDGNYFLTGSADSTVRLWSVQTGQTVRVFAGHTNAVSNVDFSPDGNYILTSSADHTVRLWEVNFRDFITFACTRVSHDFTDVERQKFHIADKKPTCPQFQQAAVGTPSATPLS